MSDEHMNLEEAISIASKVRHRPDGTSQAFDALLREIDRLNDDRKRWDALAGRKEEEQVS